MKANMRPRLTPRQTRVLNVIRASGGLVVTYVGGKPHYTTMDGEKISKKDTELFIETQWLIPDENDSLFGWMPQLYRVFEPVPNVGGLGPGRCWSSGAIAPENNSVLQCFDKKRVTMTLTSGQKCCRKAAPES